MQTQIKNLSLEQVASKNAHPNLTRKYPPYGKKLDDLRRRGLVPAMRVIVTTDWKIGGAFPALCSNRTKRKISR